MNFAQVIMIINIIVTIILKKKEHALLEGKAWDYAMIKPIQKFLIKYTEGKTLNIMGMDL